MQMQRQRPSDGKWYSGVGKDLALAVEAPTPQRTNVSTDDVPLEGLTHSFDAPTRRSQVILPRHINDLFAKITKWSSELSSSSSSSSSSSGGIKLDNSTGTIDNPSPEATRADPQLAAHAMQRAKQKLQYGALMDSFEADRHAQEHRLTLAGEKFEKQFTNWQGARLLEKVPQQAMQDTLCSKGSVVLHSPNAFKLPRVGRDPCHGCGATLQDKSENEFGYVHTGDVEQYILTWQAVFRARAEYAERMHELQTHWEKHGKRVGEEWLDFMTQEEFNAIFRFVGRPFLCRRCVGLRQCGVTTANTVMSAPDFKEKLMALREKKCVVVLVVDLTDFPGTMVPELPGLISMNNPVIICANKLDCINPCGFRYRRESFDATRKTALRVGEGYIRQWVREQALQFRLPAHQIKSVVPVSARTGWGIDDLILQIERTANLTLARPGPPLPTYFVGVSNVGKSSVINAIAHRLYVPQPPHPTAKKVYFTLQDKRTGREKIQHKWVCESKLHSAEMQIMPSTRSKRTTALMTTSSLPGTTINAVAVRIALAGRAKENGVAAPASTTDDGENNNKNNRSTPSSSSSSSSPYRAGYSKATQHAFLFDTPGLHPIWQETSPLHLRDQVRSLIRKRRNPDATNLRQGDTLFFTGCAAIDVVKAPDETEIMFFAYCSERSTTAFCETEQSDAYWREHAGMQLAPPMSRASLFEDDRQQEQGHDEQDHESSPPIGAAGLCVKRSYLFECYANHRKRPKADIYFCGLGWVSFFVSKPCDVVLRVRTLPGIVHGVRRPIRKLDMRPFRPWPKLMPGKSSVTSRNIQAKRIDTVIELENKPDEVDLSKPPILPVYRPEPVAATTHVMSSSSSSSSAPENKPKAMKASNLPFDYILSELRKQNKLA